MAFKGSFQAYDSKTMAKVVGTHLPISSKNSREIARVIAGMNLDAAIKYLEDVMDKKRAVPYKRYNRDTPHRKGNGFGAGRFPNKSSMFIINLLKSLKANASDKSLDSDNLQIVHVAAQRGSVLWHYGRLRGRRRKCTHFEAIAKAIDKPKKDVKTMDKKAIPKEIKEKVSPEVKVEKPAQKKEEIKVAAPKVENKPALKKKENATVENKK